MHLFETNRREKSYCMPMPWSGWKRRCSFFLGGPFLFIRGRFSPADGSRSPLRRDLLYLGMAVCEIPILFLGSPVLPWVFGPGLACLLLALILYGRMPDAGEFADALSFLCRPSFYRFCLAYAAIAWTTLLGTYYLSHTYHIWDTGFFGHELARYVLEGRFDSTILDKHALADHFCPNLLLLSPFFSLKITFVWLVIFKILAYLACPFVLLSIGRQMLGKDSPAVYIAPVLWIFHSLMIRNMEAEFQPSALSLPFILFSFLFALKRNHWAMFLTLIFLVGFKEHLPLVWISLGIFLFADQGEYRRGLLIIFLGIAVGLFVFFIVMPAFNLGQPTEQATKWGPIALVPAKLTLIGTALLSVGLIPLFSPRSLLMIVSAFTISLISKVPEMLTFYFHYQDIPLTILFVGVICGIRDVQRGTSWICRYSCRHRVYAALGVFFLLIVANTFSPAQYIRRHWPTDRDLALHREIETLRHHIGDDCRLWIVETAGVHFIDHPRLKVLDQWRKTWLAPLADPHCHWIVITKEPESSVLTPAQYNALKSGIDQGLQEGRYRKWDEFRQLDVYRTSLPQR